METGRHIITLLWDIRNNKIHKWPRETNQWLSLWGMVREEMSPEKNVEQQTFKARASASFWRHQAQQVRGTANSSVYLGSKFETWRKVQDEAGQVWRGQIRECHLCHNMKLELYTTGNRKKIPCYKGHDGVKLVFQMDPFCESVNKFGGTTALQKRDKVEAIFFVQVWNEKDLNRGGGDGIDSNEWMNEWMGIFLNKQKLFR